MASSRYGVQVQKGTVVRLRPHPDAVDNRADFRTFLERVEQPRVADLFCGAGGLSLGLEEAGLTTVLGVDSDEQALDTFRSLFGGLALDRDLSDPDQVAEIADLIRIAGVTVIAGGPPCQPFSRAGRATIRRLVERGVREPHDQRRDLWQSFLEIVSVVAPPAVIIENVPDMAFGDEGIILRLIVRGLEDLGYSVTSRLIDAWRYGVPQHRRRLLIVAIGDRKAFAFPQGQGEVITVGAAIGDLPPLSGGWNEATELGGYHPYAGPRTPFQKKARIGMHGVDSDRVYDHVTRAVREDDREAFSQMDTTTSYADLDDHLKRYREDIFDDKYKRLDLDGLSRTIIAHISKDGYGFIHPTEDRTISVREAARLQTFPDRVRFAGPPTSAFRQIGNAVPPALAEAVGRAVVRALEGDPGTSTTTTELSARLASWHSSHGSRSQRWLDAAETWQIVVGESMFNRPDEDVVRSVWPLLEALSSPERTLEEEDLVVQIGQMLDRTDEAGRLLESARIAAADPAVLRDLAGLSTLPSLGPSGARLVALASPQCDDDVVFHARGVLRVVARFEGSDVDRANQHSDGRVSVLRLIGADTAREANLALIELARAVCTPERPACPTCPLVRPCTFARNEGRGVSQASLFESEP